MDDSPKKSKTYKLNETLFKSVDQGLADEYLDWWAASTEAFLSFYKDAVQDGTEDAQRCRMIAAARLAQLGLTMFQFFGSAAEVIGNGKADSIACSAVSEVVADMASSKIDKWLETAAKNLN